MRVDTHSKRECLGEREIERGRLAKRKKEIERERERERDSAQERMFCMSVWVVGGCVFKSIPVREPLSTCSLHIRKIGSKVKPCPVSFYNPAQCFTLSDNKRAGDLCVTIFTLC